ncbi:MAG: DUF6171 family protein [Planctomycetaceae bacterium]|nr:DUF6171 family protein [Planctomycetaceae bacterium]
MPSDSPSTATENCKGCRTSVRIPPHEVQRILDEYLRDHPQPLADEPTIHRRLKTCAACEDLQYSTTCRHCGCLVAILAHLKGKQCPHPEGAKW